MLEGISATLWYSHIQALKLNYKFKQDIHLKDVMLVLSWVA